MGSDLELSFVFKLPLMDIAVKFETKTLGRLDFNQSNSHVVVDAGKRNRDRFIALSHTTR